MPVTVPVSQIPIGISSHIMTFLLQLTSDPLAYSKCLPLVTATAFYAGNCTSFSNTDQNSAPIMSFLLQLTSNPQLTLNIFPW